MFSALPLSLKLLLLPALSLLGLISEPQINVINPISSLSFQLRHKHATTNDTTIIFADIPPSFISNRFTINTKEVDTYSRVIPFAEPPTSSYLRKEAPRWEQVKTSAPDVQDRETLLLLAKMTYDAYYEPTHKEWYPLPDKWNNSYPFGWEPDADGFRGHIFASDDNSTVVISIKGTSPGWMVGGGGPTVEKDKFNDNLLFSCCCARVGPTWHTVCDCYCGGGKCDSDCLGNALKDDSLFYNVAINLYNNVTYLYPSANIWITGHSLGGALAGLLGATFGNHVVTFEAVPERLPASRLHLPLSPSLHQITHVFHTADPIPMGTCTGVTSSCAVGGYALESRCHLGKVIVYDTITKFGWSNHMQNHGIKVVIDKVLSADWDPDKPVPDAVLEEDCMDCYNWEFGDFKKANFEEL